MADRASSSGVAKRHRRIVGRRTAAVLLAVVASAVSVVLPASPAAACDALSIPSLDLDRCVVAGDQPQIDAGNVVRVDRLSSDHVHWLAGHRTSHGATFNSLTDLEIGALASYRGADYRVAEHLLVDRRHPDAVMGWIGARADTLVLQTSATGGYVHVWRAEMVVVQAQSAPAPVRVVASPPDGIPAALGDDVARVVRDAILVHRSRVVSWR